MKVSVLIGTRDRFWQLMRCLETVLEQDYPDLEILLLDDHSAEPLAGRLHQYVSDERLRLFRSSRPLGVAAGRNFLMRQATGDVYVVIDDDAMLDDSGAMTRIVRHLEKHPFTGILALKVIDHQNGAQQLLVPFSRRWRNKRPGLPEAAQTCSYFLGGFHAIRKQVIDICGPYYEGLIFGEEELDLSYRAIGAGFAIQYLPDVIAHHYPAQSVVGKRRGAELHHHVRNRFFLAYKYLPALAVPVYLLVWLLIYALQAGRQLAFGAYLTGFWAGIRELRKTKRMPLNRAAVHYLKLHYGRVWY
ncbi:GT2 family glycosyltransferase [Tumebacillus sp. BK434]|uniref:glycosyltransferase family 2 protein n=1 Tax=Tumebacillus sp. BK434 TaxID=2512169 RepID=UPI00104E2428|nr:glycosyltransferase [Tumebacillus sp. BK434]TCP58975.1 GT2 family glycosyltransferase [Tumebacillus sp. BK434]